MRIATTLPDAKVNAAAVSNRPGLPRRFGYSRLRRLGPNDGLTMLVDQVLPGGLTIVEPGVDHYFDHPNRELRSLGLLEVMLTRPGVTTRDRLPQEALRCSNARPVFVPCASF